MNRTAALLSALGAVVLLALFWFLLYSPQRADIAALDVQADGLRSQQQTTLAEIARLEIVRTQIPQIEANIAAAESVVPRSAALPSTLRQLVLAADSSGVVIESITPTRPIRSTSVDEAVVLPPDLASIQLSLSVTGGYFQVVDFLRRIEDPTQIARGIVWEALDIAPDEYPALTVLISGQMYAILPDVDVAPATVDEPTDTATDAATETPTEAAAAEAGP